LATVGFFDQGAIKIGSGITHVPAIDQGYGFFAQNWHAHKQTRYHSKQLFHTFSWKLNHI
jgi:hypothetical protein